MLGHHDLGREESCSTTYIFWHAVMCISRTIFEITSYYQPENGEKYHALSSVRALVIAT